MDQTRELVVSPDYSDHSNSTSGSVHLPCLPGEVIKYIFSYLDRSGLKQASNLSTFWNTEIRNLTFSTISDNFIFITDRIKSIFQQQYPDEYAKKKEYQSIETNMCIFSNDKNRPGLATIRSYEQQLAEEMAKSCTILEPNELKGLSRQFNSMPPSEFKSSHPLEYEARRMLELASIYSQLEEEISDKTAQEINSHFLSLIKSLLEWDGDLDKASEISFSFLIGSEAKMEAISAIVKKYVTKGNFEKAVKLAENMLISEQKEELLLGIADCLIRKNDVNQLNKLLKGEWIYIPRKAMNRRVEKLIKDENYQSAITAITQFEDPMDQSNALKKVVKQLLERKDFKNAEKFAKQIPIEKEKCKAVTEVIMQKAAHHIKKFF